MHPHAVEAQLGDAGGVLGSHLRGEDAALRRISERRGELEADARQRPAIWRRTKHDCASAQGCQNDRSHVEQPSSLRSSSDTLYIRPHRELVVEAPRQRLRHVPRNVVGRVEAEAVRPVLAQPPGHGRIGGYEGKIRKVCQVEKKLSRTSRSLFSLLAGAAGVRNCDVFLSLPTGARGPAVRPVARTWRRRRPSSARPPASRRRSSAPTARRARPRGRCPRCRGAPTRRTPKGRCRRGRRGARRRRR